MTMHPPDVHASMDRVHFPTEGARAWTHQLTSAPDVIAVVAIGSSARGVARGTSDLDLIVVYRNARPRMRPPGEIDARWVHVADLEEIAGRADDVVAWGIAYGVGLHDPHGVWRDLASRHASRLVLPSPAICIERAARARRYAAELLSAGDDDAAREQVITMLTHLARLLLTKRGVLPASRPELVNQLEKSGEHSFAALLQAALEDRLDPGTGLERAAALLGHGALSRTA
jgi:predicted nucleotidyltransferase